MGPFLDDAVTSLPEARVLRHLWTRVRQGGGFGGSTTDGESLGLKEVADSSGVPRWSTVGWLAARVFLMDLLTDTWFGMWARWHLPSAFFCFALLLLARPLWAGGSTYVDGMPKAATRKMRD